MPRIWKRIKEYETTKSKIIRKTNNCIFEGLSMKFHLWDLLKKHFLKNIHSKFYWEIHTRFHIHFEGSAEKISWNVLKTCGRRYVLNLDKKCKNLKPRGFRAHMDLKMLITRDKIFCLRRDSNYRSPFFRTGALSNRLLRQVYLVTCCIHESLGLKLEGERSFFLGRYTCLSSPNVHRYGTGGSMRACHVAGPGSIPGRDKFPGWGFFWVFPHL